MLLLVELLHLNEILDAQPLRHSVPIAKLLVPLYVVTLELPLIGQLRCPKEVTVQPQHILTIWIAPHHHLAFASNSAPAVQRCSPRWVTSVRASLFPPRLRTAAQRRIPFSYELSTTGKILKFIRRKWTNSFSKGVSTQAAIPSLEDRDGGIGNRTLTDWAFKFPS